MNEKELKNIGIMVTKKADNMDSKKIADMVAKKLTIAFPNEKFEYSDIYNKIVEMPIYYAQISDELTKVNYIYKNSTLYLSEDINLTDNFEYILHECIHKIQETKDKKEKITRFGLCEVNDFSVKAIALNEGAIQYIVAKALKKPLKEMNVYQITLKERTQYYPLITNIITQLVFLLGEDDLVDSTINSNENFKIKIIDNIGESEYHFIEKSMDKILNLKKNFYETKNADELIKNLYFEIQNKILKGYFDTLLKRTENEFEIEMVTKKLVEFGEIIGKAQNENSYKSYFADFTERANKRKEKLKNNRLLAVIKDNTIIKLFKKIRGLFLDSIQ